MNLYLLSTKLGDYYVVEESPNHAQNKLESLLSLSNYGFGRERKVTNIKLVAEEIKEFAGKPNFSSGNRLVAPSTLRGDIKVHVLEFLYRRLIDVHGENENYDYMINLQEIINRLPIERY